MMVGVVALAAGWSDLAGGEHVLGAVTGWLLAESARRTAHDAPPTLPIIERIGQLVPRDRRSLRNAAAPLLVGVLCGALWHTYHPIAATAAAPRPTGAVTAIAFTDRAAIPVRAEGVEIDGSFESEPVATGWWSSTPRCEHATNARHKWVWRRRVWWCMRLDAATTSHRSMRLDYSVLGIPQSLVIRPS